MNWIIEAKVLFNIDKPAHFTNHEHCEECAEHDEILLSKSIDSIGLDELEKWGGIRYAFVVMKEKYTTCPPLLD